MLSERDSFLVFGPTLTTYGTADPDMLTATQEGELIFGLNEADRLSTNIERTKLVGGAGDDALTATNTEAILDGGEGNDRLVTSFIESFIGAYGPTSVQAGGAGNDELLSEITAVDGAFSRQWGDEGNDLIRSIMRASNYGGFALADGGDGDDVLEIDLQYSGDYSGAVLQSRTYGGDGDDHIQTQLSGAVIGGLLTNLSEGGNGDDVILARTDAVDPGSSATNDVDGGAGDDQLSLLAFSYQSAQSRNVAKGGEGNDIINASIGIYAPNESSGTGRNEVWGGAGEDIITLEFIGVGRGISAENTVEGGSGNDQITSNSNINASSSVLVNRLSGGDGDDKINATATVISTNDFLMSSYVEHRLDGGAGDDILSASIEIDALHYSYVEAASLLSGGTGNDQLKVFGGTRNVLDGGAGNDTLTGGSGDDRLAGGEGIDTAVFSGRASDYSIVAGASGIYTITDLRVGSPDGSDSVSGVEWLQFADQRVHIIGEATPGYVGGSAGDNDLRATQDPDGTIFNASGGNDILRGGRYDDILTGGSGDDQMYAGAGADQYRFFGDQIEGVSDTDRVYDLNFDEGDVLVFGTFGTSTFFDSVGVNAFAGGSAAILDSYDALVDATEASDRVTAFRQAAGNENLVFRVTDVDGQVQDIVITGGWLPFLAAGGEAWL